MMIMILVLSRRHTQYSLSVVLGGAGTVSAGTLSCPRGHTRGEETSSACSLNEVCLCWIEARLFSHFWDGIGNSRIMSQMGNSLFQNRHKKTLKTKRRQSEGLSSRAK